MGRHLAHAVTLLAVGFLPLSGLGPAPAVAREVSPPSPVAQPKGPMGFGAWIFWYHHNADRLEALAAPIRTAPLDGVLASRREAILTTLQDLLDPRVRADVHDRTAASACRALARVTRSPADAERLETLLADPSQAQTVREGAALGLGLLRRSEPTQALPDSVHVAARRTLLQVASDASAPTRLRGFAVLALGLLGGPSAAERLTAFVRGASTDYHLAPAGLHALTLLPPGSVSETTLRLLTEAVRKGTIADSAIPDLVQAYAAVALGRHGAAAESRALVDLLRRRRRVGANTLRSAGVALGRISTRLPLDERERLARSILERLRLSKDPSTRHALIMALVPLLAAGPQNETATLLARTAIDERLLRIATRGKYRDRSYGGLALGLLLRGFDGVTGQRHIASFQKKALRALHRGLRDRDLQPRSAFALALGLARDASAVPVLRAMAADGRRDPSIRGYALLALAFVAPDDETHHFARAQLERTPGGLHALLAARVLGLTGDYADRSTVELLRRAVVGARPEVPCGEAAVALARIGSVEAADVLLAVAPDIRQQDLARSVAVVGLGRIADPERVPSLCLLTAGLNHRAGSDLLSELFSLF